MPTYAALTLQPPVQLPCSCSSTLVPMRANAPLPDLAYRQVITKAPSSMGGRSMPTGRRFRWRCHHTHAVREAPRRLLTRLQVSVHDGPRLELMQVQHAPGDVSRHLEQLRVGHRRVGHDLRQVAACGELGDDRRAAQAVGGSDGAQELRWGGWGGAPQVIEWPQSKRAACFLWPGCRRAPNKCSQP